MTSSASPSRSRASSVENAPPTVGATSRWALGNRGSVGCALQAVSARTAAAAAPSLVDILYLDRLARHPLRQRRRHEAVEIAIEHIARRGGRNARPQILHQLVRLEHIGPDLVAPA